MHELPRLVSTVEALKQGKQPNQLLLCIRIAANNPSKHNKFGSALLHGPPPSDLGIGKALC
eukprot:scaffold90121_cov30-Tisochrysis_lutea.AAC.5